VYNENPALKRISKPHSKGKERNEGGTNFELSENIFSMHLPYNSNQALDLESWDGNFNLISLHKSIEHLVSGAKNIKEFLYYIQKYILNKKIESNKANDINDLKGIGEAAWGFISLLYNSG